MLLDGRTFDRTVGAIHAAVAFFWFEQRSAAFATIEKLASICWHGIRFGMSTIRTGNR